MASNRTKKSRSSFTKSLDALHEAFNNHVTKEEGWQKELMLKVDRVDERTNRMDNVTANGTKGFENIIHEIYMVTAGPRRRYKFKRAFGKWFERHKTIASVLIYLGKRIGLLLLGALLLWVAQHLGLRLGDEIVKLIHVVLGGGI